MTTNTPPILIKAPPISISLEEIDYLGNMAQESLFALKAINLVSKLLEPIFQSNKNNLPLLTYGTHLNSCREIFEKLHQWAATNLRMTHFPVDYAELENAKKLAIQGYKESHKLAEKHREILATTNHFDGFKDLRKKVSEIGERSDAIYVLIFRSQLAVSHDGSTVDPKKLIPLP